MNNYKYINKVKIDEHHTDQGNARRLIRDHATNIKYIPAWQKWITWDGNRWKPDEDGEIVRLGLSTVVSILDDVSSLYREAANAKSQKKTDKLTEKARELSSWAMKCQSNSRLNSMITLAQSQPEAPINHEELDADHWKLNTLSGLVDLKTGQLIPHAREHYATKLAPVAYEPSATCPRWLEFLDQIFAGDKELIDFIQKMVGCMLTGVTVRALFMAWGDGRNGKTTFINVLRKLTGEYSQQADFTTFLERDREGAARNDIARMKGARLVCASEGPEGKTFNEAIIKQLTGGDRITARYLNKEFFEFDATWKIFLATNHKPIVKGNDTGIWDRIKLIPFKVKIPLAEVDRELPDKLNLELPGILQWAVQGCLKWQTEGLDMPHALEQEVAGYREEMDSIGNWIAGSCITAPTASSKSSDLYASYREWSQAAGEFVISQKMFSTRLAARGYAKQKTRFGAIWNGIGLISN
ncbi:MAG: phage/plasmid primase, P4 family [Candidatus Thiodiazotropha endolucinida]|nr:phage/plasmid primase, P4 family [Candidatus Thiodiazotropha taylori]MCW4262071.1 phage/plasmid primase, P4 family [Candidatus Thiodiazotropha endolucinida]